MKFSLPGDDGEWKEGKLVLENGSLIFDTQIPSKLEHQRSPSPFPAPISSIIDAILGKRGRGKEKTEKKGFFVPISSIRDVKQEGNGILLIKHTDNRNISTGEPGSESESDPLVVSTKLSADEKVLNEVERELVMSLSTYNFNVFFTHAGEGGVLSMEKNVELEKGLLKLSSDVLWIIGQTNHKRIAWDDIVNVEQKKRSRFKGTEFGAISFDYFGEGSNEVISTIVITQGTTIEVLKRHALELLKEYKVSEKLPDMENQILTMMYAGALDLSSSAIAATAEAFGLSEEELKNHLEHMSELGIVDPANQTLTKKGIKYVVDLSKDGTFGG